MSIFKPQPVPKRKRGRPRKNPPVAPGTAPGLVGRPRVKPFGPEPPRVRKPREPVVTRPRVVPVRLSEDEHAAFKRAADRAGLTLSAWIRNRLLREIGEKLELGPYMPGVVTAEGTFVQTPDGIIKT